jgi:flagellar biosynthesis protein FlhF
MPATSLKPVPGACYKFVVNSAEDAAALIREKLGPAARVLTVRSVPASGLKRLWAGPRLEVIAQIDAGVEAPEERRLDAPAPLTELISAEPAMPPRSTGRPAKPVRHVPTLPTLLRRSGLSELALGRLQESPLWPELMAAPLHRALVEVGRRLQEDAEKRWSGAPLTRAAFLGTAGVGRTTALCKWLGLEVFRRARLGHVVTAEFERPNPPGALPVFCEALGVPVARFPAATQPAVPGGFVYFDLPGISLRDPAENAPIAQFLGRERIEQRVLVLNAAYDHATLRAAYAAGRDLGATHLVFTHLDEVPQWGRLWDYLLDGALEPLFLGTGPSLTGDCAEDVFAALVRRTLAGGAGEATDEPGDAADAETEAEALS